MAQAETSLLEPWFERADFETARAERTLSRDVDEIVDGYARDGFARIDFGFDDDLLDAVEAETRALYGEVARVQDLWRKSDAVRELAANPKVLALLSALYERQCFPFQTLNFPVGTQQNTHSDTYHFNSFPQRFMCGLWVALEEIDEENGPLHYYRGSQKLPVYSPTDIGSGDYGDYEQFVADRMVEGGYAKELGTLKRGEAILWSANLFHGGDPIRDPTRSRTSQVTHYYFDDCLYYTPLGSSDETVLMRAPYDFASKRYVKNRLLGKTITPSLRSMAAIRAANWLKRTPAAPVA